MAKATRNLPMPAMMQNAPGEALQAIVDELLPRFAQRAAQADEDDAFVAANYADLKSNGLVGAGVPAELGGLGASHAELCEMLRRMAMVCGSTALAFAMH